MKNEQYLMTLLACGKIKDLERDWIDYLSTIEINIKDSVDKIRSIIDTKNEGLILKGIGLVIKNNRGKEKDLDKCIEDLCKFLRVYKSVFCLDIYEEFLALIEFVGIGPLSGITKWKTISSGEMSIYINGIEHRIYFKEDKKNLVNTILIDGYDNDIGGIFFKEIDGNIKIEYKRVKDIKDTIKIVKRVLRNEDSYDVAIIPRKYNWCSKSSNRFYKKYIENGLEDAGEYLDLIAFIEKWSFSDKEMIEQYDKIRNKGLNAIKLLDLLYIIDGEVESGLKLINILTDINLSNKDVSEIKEIIGIKLKYIRYKNGYDIFETMLDKIKGISDIQEIKKIIREDKESEISYISNDEEIYTINNMRESGTYLRLDSKGRLRTVSNKEDSLLDSTGYVYIDLSK